MITCHVAAAVRQSRLPWFAGLGLLFAGLVAAAEPAELHVAMTGRDTNPGTRALPLRTIQTAADRAQPGDLITVHAGVYRERVNPPRGGDDHSRRITYQAAPGEKVEIKGSEVIKQWVRVQGNTWQATLPNSFFGNFNPYGDLIRGDWFKPKDREHHTGAVYLDGVWLAEAATLDEVMRPVGGTPCWFGRVGEEHTTIWAQFAGVDPNERQVEINVRQTVFYPDLPGRNYLTVRGFIMRHAATPWAPPTTEQMALIGTHWSKGWLIENNVISHSICSGLSLGKYGDQPGRKAQSAEAYVKVVERAIANGWSKENIGGHIVRNNVISHCEQAGIVGSLGAVFSTIEGNMIHDVHVRRLFGGEEMAGIKLHGAIDVRIARNRIYRTVLGLWLDWMAQGTQVSGNLFHDNGHDLFAEVNHGPYLVDHNIFLSPGSVFSMSQGGAFAHNLMAGRIRLSAYNKRATPYHRPHSTEIAGMHENPSGDDRFHHNLIVGRGDLSAYDNATWPVWMDGNVFLQGAKPSQHEVEPTVRPEYDPELKCAAQGEGCYLTIRMDGDWAARRPRRLITTELLGRARIPDQPFVHPDGSPLALNRDYFGQRRDESHPVPGPFEHRASGLVTFKVW